MSAIFHALAVTAALTVHFSSDAPPPVEEHPVALVVPRLTTPTIAPPPPRRRPEPTRPQTTPPVAPIVEAPVAPVVEAAARTAPRQFRAPAAPQAVAPRAVEISTPAPEITITAPAAPPPPRADLAIALPKPIVTGVLSSAGAVPETPAAPAAAVKSAGFGSSQTAGNGPARGTVTNVGGFGSAGAAGGNAPRQTATLKTASFGDAKAATPSAPAQRTAAPAAATPVEIVSKPRPAYTAEARAARIEGEVTLEVLFTASGEARVLRVIEGLGHGLNETAAAAARAIEFRPAKRAGVAVDSTARVHIVFQLAY